MPQYRLVPCVLLSLVALSTATLRAASDPTRDAKKRVAEARSEVLRATNAMSAATRKVRQQIEALPEWKEAAAAARDAGARYTAAANAVRKKLAQQPAYKAAAAERSKRQAELAEAKSQPNPKRERITDAAVAALNAEAGVSRIEHAALAADPVVTDAKSALDHANIRLAELRRKFPEYAQKDEGYQAAKQRLDEANAKYTDAAKELAQAKQQQEDEEARKMDRELNDARTQLQDLAGWRR